MIRDIISIDREKCNGCGLCVDACYEGAIAMVNGKAKLVREDHCDGLGYCLPECPAGALTIIKKDALPFTIEPDIPMIKKKNDCGCVEEVRNRPGSRGEMTRWPIQMRLVPLKAPFYNGADLLVASDCTAYVSKSFHQDFVKDRVILIGCPKLDREDYSQRLARIIDDNDIRSINLVRINISCCSEMARMVREAIRMCTKNIPLTITVLDTDGNVVEQ